MTQINLSKRLPLAPIETMMKEATNLRISASGAEKMRELLDMLLYELAREAADFAKHTGRKTIKDRDVAVAFRRMFS